MTMGKRIENVLVFDTNGRELGRAVVTPTNIKIKFHGTMYPETLLNMLSFGFCNGLNIKANVPALPRGKKYMP